MKILSALFVLTISATMVVAQSVPQAVQTAFSNKFPYAQAEWEEDNGLFEAKFEDTAGSASVLFSSDGSWVATERRLYDDKITEIALDQVKKNYGTYSIVEAEKVESATEGSYTKMELNGSEGTVELKVFPNGKAIAEKVSTDDEND